MRRIPQGIVFALVLGCAADARAFVRGVTPAGNQYFWPVGCEIVTVYTNGYSGLGRDEIAKSVAAAAQAWGSSVSCPPGAGAAVGQPGPPPSFEIIVAMASEDARAEAANDGRSVVVFPTPGWPYQADALALTTHSADPAGRIMHTDIEINPTVAWANLDPGAPPESHGIERFDLQTVMTHEFGHFIGLAHTCTSVPGEGSDEETETPVSLVDDRGAPIPACTNVLDATNAQAAESVMWYLIDPESTAKRTLAPDDVRAVCEMYPADAGTSCPVSVPDDGCGCSATPSGGDGRAAVWLLSLLVLRSRRRPHRRPSSS